MRIDLSKVKKVVIIDENGKNCDEFILSSALYIQERSVKSEPRGELRLKKHKPEVKES